MQLWKNRALCEQNPRSLLYTLCICLPFNLVIEVAKSIMKRMSKISAWTRTSKPAFEVNLTKTRQGSLRKKRSHPPKYVCYCCFPLSSPVLQSYLAHRPEEIRNRGPFYLKIVEKPKSEVWCKRQRMGVNEIDSFLKNIALEAETTTNNTSFHISLLHHMIR